MAQKITEMKTLTKTKIQSIAVLEFSVVSCNHWHVLFDRLQSNFSAPHQLLFHKLTVSPDFEAHMDEKLLVWKFERLQCHE